MKRPKGKKEKGLSVDSLYIYCKYPRVCPVHDTRFIRQLQDPSSSRISSLYWRFVDLGRKKYCTNSFSSRNSRKHSKIQDERNYGRCPIVMLPSPSSGTFSFGMHQRRDRETHHETNGGRCAGKSGT